jgi:hypothetical protein
VGQLLGSSLILRNKRATLVIKVRERHRFGTDVVTHSLEKT